MNYIASINVHMKSSAMSVWHYVLQKGFYLDGIKGMTVRNFLHEALHFDDEYIEGTVRTIFLNNKPVDDIDAVCLKEGDRVALGSAMPGLVGIVMGRDNPYKSFRSSISAEGGGSCEEATPITVSVKLFSTLAVETAKDVMGRGIGVEAAPLGEYLETRCETLEAKSLDVPTELQKLSGVVQVTASVTESA